MLLCGSPLRILSSAFFLNVRKNRARWELSISMRSYLMRAVFNRVATLRRHLRVELAVEETILRDGS